MILAIENGLRKLQEIDINEPYRWTWKREFFKHTIKVVAYDTVGYHDSDEINVWKFF